MRSRPFEGIHLGTCDCNPLCPQLAQMPLDKVLAEGSTMFDLRLPVALGFERGLS